MTDLPLLLQQQIREKARHVTARGLGQFICANDACSGYGCGGINHPIEWALEWAYRLALPSSHEEAVKQFRMDELEAVMLSVDKWLDYDEDDPKRPNPATRSAEAREVALRAIEKLEVSAAEKRGLIQDLTTALENRNREKLAAEAALARLTQAHDALRERCARVARCTMLSYERKPLEMMSVYGDAVAEAIRALPSPPQEPT